MSKKGRSIEEIADCVDFDVETVKKWIRMDLKDKSAVLYYFTLPGCGVWTAA